RPVGVDEPDLLQMTMTPSLTARFSTGTALRLQTPAGFVRMSPEQGQTQTSFGLGDVGFEVQQALHSFWGPARGALQFYVRGGMTAPTGRYGTDAALSVQAFNNTLDRITHTTQLSLGDGAWVSTAGFDAVMTVGARSFVGVQGTWREPLTETPDGIRWGRDWYGRAAWTVALLPNALALTGGFDAHRHEANRALFDGVDERFGDRTEIGTELGIRLRSSAWSCGLSGHVPVWQRADGVQLVEVFSVRVDCGYSAIE
ncbi:MAG: hypothetical protein AAF449_04680, partial [Myxococcota bacterium]